MPMRNSEEPSTVGTASPDRPFRDTCTQYIDPVLLDYGHRESQYAVVARARTVVEADGLQSSNPALPSDELPANNTPVPSAQDDAEFQRLLEQYMHPVSDD